MSPRAALRLEMLGFADVRDYVAGINDWISARLPIEGTRSLGPRAADVIDPDVPVCAPSDPIEKAARALSDGAGRCIVTNAGGIVLGELRTTDVRGKTSGTAEDHMRPGPTTIRPIEHLDGLIDRMRSAGVSSVLVTTPEGKLLGLVNREQAEHRLHAWHEQHHAG